MRQRLRIPAALLCAAGLATAVTQLTAPAARAAGDPRTMTSGFCVSPGHSAAVWAAAHPTDGREPAIKSAIATKPDAVWFSGGESAIGTSTGAYVAPRLTPASCRCWLPTTSPTAMSAPGSRLCGTPRDTAGP
jgi:endoglucanase